MFHLLIDVFYYSGLFSNGIYIVTNSTLSSKSLRINIGFLLHQDAGYTREIIFDETSNLTVDEASKDVLLGTIRLTRTPQGILLQGELHSQTPVDCMRCLKTFDYPFNIEFSELFVPANSPTLDNNDANPLPTVIDEGDYIDLTPIVREEGILAIPMRVLCSEDCKGLCSQCGQNLNEASCECEADTIDPRLASLRALLDDEK